MNEALYCSFENGKVTSLVLNVEYFSLNVTELAISLDEEKVFFCGIKAFS